jgi:hypothetical protein
MSAMAMQRQLQLQPFHRARNARLLSETAG